MGKLVFMLRKQLGQMTAGTRQTDSRGTPTCFFPQEVSTEGKQALGLKQERCEASSAVAADLAAGTWEQFQMLRRNKNPKLADHTILTALRSHLGSRHS